ncbi:MAG: hypothetical protein JKY17_06535 [Magnetovibrio sp.]|nr:hypothetical protein [Magnetovibrio sp.]
MNKWQPIETAPKDQRVLIWSGTEVYAAHWVKNPFTDDEAWLLGTAPDDMQTLVAAPILWHPCPCPPNSEDGANKMQNEFHKICAQTSSGDDDV